tara:strand:- start:1165 stop:3030 length:1866 start_codon:yes stop_codon:yes gene_type:complete
LKNFILRLARGVKASIAVTSDYILLTLSFYLSLSIRDNIFYQPTSETLFLILLAPLLAVPIFYAFGLYKAFVRYSSYQVLNTIIKGVSIYTIAWFILVYLSGIVEKPYDFLVINWMVSVFLSVSIRWFAGWFLSEKKNKDRNVLIYGAGEAGIQIFSALHNDPEINIVAFIDDNKAKQGRSIENIRINKPADISSLIKNKSVNEILVAMPSVPKSEVSEILQGLKQFEITIRVLPGFADLAHGRATVTDLKKVKIEDLLNRDVRLPDKKLISKDIEGKVVLVTGAGGSIGSQLSREIIFNNPSRLIILDISEYSLYKIERELESRNKEVEVISILADILDEAYFKRILKKFEVQTMYHTAAYKHVPMVEKNITASIKTNIFGTFSCISAALECDLECFVYISTDKAVRPTNIMGATKRFAEQILQVKSKNEDRDTRVSIVRFGNVLGSSGSVVPLFREQIKNGGPVTVTDPNIVRYFMTIKEAAQLVIQAGALGDSGNIFLLDMGEPVKITNLAKDMIRLSGQTTKDSNNPKGDIEIIYTGLRPGEKLYEELLIGSDMKKTIHEKIFYADEESFSSEELEGHMKQLKVAASNDDLSLIKSIFLKSVSGYSDEYDFVDPMKQ